MKKAIVALLLIFLHVHSVFAKKDFSVDSIKGIDWEQISPDFGKIGVVYSWAFEDNKHIRCIQHRDSVYRIEMDYYLSQTRDTVFDRTKIGKSSKGEFIIFHRKVDYKGEVEWFVDCYEIVSISSKQMVVKSPWGRECVFENKGKHQQKSFQLQLLSGKEWRLLSPTVRAINQGWIVGDSTITVFYESKKDGGRATSQSGYYISETKDPQFDPAKVGTNKEGKYIIIGIMRDNPASSEKVCETVIYEIENITSTSLVVTSRGERFVFSTSPLQGKDWVVKSPQIDSIKRGWIFNDTIMTRYIELNDGKRADIEVQYYLSDAKDETFDKEKVGTTAQGKYIIAHRKQMVGKIPTAQYTTEQFEIVSLSPDELVVISPLGTKAVLEANE